jgi:cellulose 1,4-beta-cellobiosidase
MLSSLGLAAAQQVGNVQNETHPKLQWTKCAADGSCGKINGEVVIDANWRWIHKTGNLTYNCYDWNKWDWDVCGSVEDCTKTCAIEGATYDRVYGVKTANDTLTARLKTNFDFSHNIASRLFLLESKNRYQMFTLLNNELTFDVDLSTVECGINSALYFVPMDPDGGQAKYPTNQAGAEYGTGYCDATCPRDLKWIEGKANFESWIPSATDEFAGVGRFGACCPQFSVWNSNAHSFSMSSHVCPEDGFFTCDHYQQNCQFDELYPDERKKKCDFWGCGYNAYRMGNTEFYGKGKKVDTARKFTWALPSLYFSPRVCLLTRLIPVSLRSGTKQKSRSSSSKTAKRSTCLLPPGTACPKRPGSRPTCARNSVKSFRNVTSWPRTEVGKPTTGSCWSSPW